MSTPTRKLKLSGGTLTGPLTLSGDPTEALHAASKAYVDSNMSLGNQAWQISGSGSNYSLTGTFAPVNFGMVGLSWVEKLADLVGNGASGADSDSDSSVIGVAIYGGQLQISTDSGATWTARDSSRNWNDIAMNSDGTKMVACVDGGQLYTSTDSGATWTARDSARSWKAVASSTDGAKLVACVDGGQIYTSTDSGANWTARDSVRNWESVASSDSGENLVACVNAGQIYTSADSGATWTARETERLWQSVDNSATGAVIVAAAITDGEADGVVMLSTDSGATWSDITYPTAWTARPFGVSISSNGNSVLVSDYGRALITTNQGATWLESSVGLSSATACADDFSTVIVATITGAFLGFDFVGGVFISTTAGSAFGVTLPTAGTYLVKGILSVTAGGTNDGYCAQFYNSTAAAAVASSERCNSNVSINATAQVILENLVTVSAASEIHLQAKNTTAARGTVVAAATSISYIRLY